MLAIALSFMMRAWLDRTAPCGSWSTAIWLLVNLDSRLTWIPSRFVFVQTLGHGGVLELARFRLASEGSGHRVE